MTANSAAEVLSTQWSHRSHTHSSSKQNPDEECRLTECGQISWFTHYSKVVNLVVTPNKKPKVASFVELCIFLLIILNRDPAISLLCFSSFAKCKINILSSLACWVSMPKKLHLFHVEQEFTSSRGNLRTVCIFPCCITEMYRSKIHFYNLWNLSNCEIQDRLWNKFTTSDWTEGQKGWMTVWTWSFSWQFSICF